MDKQKYDRLRRIAATVVAMIVSVGVVSQNYLLALAGVVSGMVFLALARSQIKILTDEREKIVQEKAAYLTYTIFAPTLGIGTFLLLFPSLSGLSVFAKGEFFYLESLGQIFAYLTLLLITVYALSYHFLNRRYGGDADEK